MSLISYCRVPLIRQQYKLNYCIDLSDMAESNVNRVRRSPIELRRNGVHDTQVKP
jgi:hypothetical protein